MQKVLESFLCQCEQLESLITDELEKAEQKDSILNFEFQQKSSQQINAFERSKLTSKIETTKRRIQELKFFIAQIEQYQNEEILKLEKYFTDAHKNHPMIQVDDLFLTQSNQQCSNDLLVQQLYMQIQHLQIKTKNLELDLQSKEIVCDQLKELIERHKKLEVALDSLNQTCTLLEDKNSKLKSENDQLIQVSTKFELSNRQLHSQHDCLVDTHKKLEVAHDQLKRESLVLEQSNQNLYFEQALVYDQLYNQEYLIASFQDDYKQLKQNQNDQFQQVCTRLLASNEQFQTKNHQLSLKVKELMNQNKYLKSFSELYQQEKEKSQQFTNQNSTFKVDQSLNDQRLVCQDLTVKIQFAQNCPSIVKIQECDDVYECELKNIQEETKEQKAKAGVCPLCKIYPLLKKNDQICEKCQEESLNQKNCLTCGERSKHRYQLVCDQCDQQHKNCSQCNLFVSNNYRLCDSCLDLKRFAQIGQTSKCSNCLKKTEILMCIPCAQRPQRNSSQFCPTCGNFKSFDHEQICQECISIIEEFKIAFRAMQDRKEFEVGKKSYKKYCHKCHVTMKYKRSVQKWICPKCQSYSDSNQSQKVKR